MANSDPIPPEKSWDSNSGGRFNDDSDELAVEEIYDLIFSTPSHHVLIAASHWSIYVWYPPTGTLTTNKNSAILFRIIPQRTLISRRNFLMSHF